MTLQTHSILLALLLCAAAACSSKSDDDDDDIITTVDDDDTGDDTEDDTGDDTDEFNYIECTLACPEGKICDPDGSCRQPAYPVLQEGAEDQPSYEGASMLLINGRRITPVGETLGVATFPTNMEMSPDGKWVVVNENGGGTRETPGGRRKHTLTLVEAATMEVKQRVFMPNGTSLHGLRFNADGSRLAVSGGEDRMVHFYTLNPESGLALEKSVSAGDCYPADLLYSPSGDRLYVSCIVKGMVSVINTADDTLAGQWAAGNRAFTMALSNDGSRLFVTNWATTFRSDFDTVTVLDTADGTVVKTINVGLGPEGLVRSPDGSRLYSIASKTDEIWEINVAALTASPLLRMHSEDEEPRGVQPVMADLSPDGAILYVTSTTENCVDVIDIPSASIKGRIPAGWYTSDVILAGSNLYVLNARGRGDGPNGESRSDPGDDSFGLLQKLALPDPATLSGCTETVAINNARALGFFDTSGGNDSPVPSEYGVGSEHIKYVIWVMKENMSYDAGFGAFEKGNGDPSLAFWTEEMLPNQWKLAREFALLDNFYSEADNSVCGHTWMAAGTLPDWTQKAVMADGQAMDFIYPTPGFDPGSLPYNEMIVPHMLTHGISARIYGVGEQLGNDAFGKYADTYNTDYPLIGGAAYDLPDRDKAQIFIDELEQMVAEGTVPRFMFLSLPNNHTKGLEVGSLRPESMVADNDEGVGKIVQAVSQSSIWKETAIFIFEDDTQNGYDHVDAHRAPTLVISPWVRRGALSSVVYSYPSLFKTLNLIMGTPPLTRFETNASAMYDLFTARPDLTPYTMLPRTWPDEIYRGDDAVLTKISGQMEWAEVDQAEAAAPLLWRYLKRTDPPMHVFFDSAWEKLAK